MLTQAAKASVWDKSEIEMTPAELAYIRSEQEYDIHDEQQERIREWRMKKLTPNPKTAKAKDELHIGLDIPKQAATEVYNWVQEQDWPKGTELEPLEDYHITMLFSQSDGASGHRDDDWIEHDSHAVTVKSVKEFPPSEERDGLHPIVLFVDSDTIHDHHSKLAEGAEAAGVDPGPYSKDKYQPHMTVAYGPGLPKGLKPPKLTFETAESSVSTPREEKESAWRFGFAADPEWFRERYPDSPSPGSQPAMLWHGTKMENLPSIMEHGLVPWDSPGTRGLPPGSPWEEEDPNLVPRPGHVYLAESPGSANEAAGLVHGGDKRHLILGINPRHLDPENVNPDEDAYHQMLEQETNEEPGHPDEDWRPMTLGDKAELHGLGEGNDAYTQTQEGIERTNTLAHRGTIPPHAITPYFWHQNRATGAQELRPVPQEHWNKGFDLQAYDNDPERFQELHAASVFVVPVIPVVGLREPPEVAPESAEHEAKQEPGSGSLHPWRIAHMRAPYEAELLKLADSWNPKDQWPNALRERNGEPVDADCTCKDGHKLDCPVHGMHPELPTYDDTLEFPNPASPVGYDFHTDAPRTWMRAETKTAANAIGWTRGNRGKGLVAPDGTVFTWNVSEDGQPHHGEYMDKYHPYDLNEGHAHFFQIRPRGGLDTEGYDLPANMIRNVLQADPRLKAGEHTDWHFGAAQLYRPDDEDYMLEQCAAYADGLMNLKPGLKLGIHWDDHHEPDEEDEGGEETSHPQHYFAHDDKYAYDAMGRHPLPYEDWDRTTYNHDPDEIWHYGMHEGGYVPPAEEHALKHDVFNTDAYEPGQWKIAADKADTREYQDSRMMPPMTQAPGATNPHPEKQGCTCEEGHKLDCPVHGLEPTEQGYDHTWSIPEGHPVGYPQDQPRNYMKAEGSWHFAGETLPQQMRRWQDIRPHPRSSRSEVVHTFPDNWTVQEHKSKFAVQAVGQMMRNCWQGKRPNLNAEGALISKGRHGIDAIQHFMALHDENDIPRVAFYVNEFPEKVYIPGQGFQPGEYGEGDKKIRSPWGVRNKRISDGQAERLQSFAREHGISDRFTIPEGIPGQDEPIPATIQAPVNLASARTSSWHLTDNPNFALDPEFKPYENYLMGGDAKNPGMYVTDDPEYWVNGHDYVRPFAAELEHPPLDMRYHEHPQGYLPASMYPQTKVKRVIPLDEYVREEYGAPGWIEEHHDHPDTSYHDLPKYPNYRYEGPDVRDMTPEEQQRHMQRAKEYLETRPGWQRRTELDREASGQERGEQDDTDTHSRADKHGAKQSANDGREGDEDHSVRVDHWRIVAGLPNPLDWIIHKAIGRIPTQEELDQMIRELGAPKPEEPTEGWTGLPRAEGAVDEDEHEDNLEGDGVAVPDPPEVIKRKLREQKDRELVQESLR